MGKKNLEFNESIRAFPLLPQLPHRAAQCSESVLYLTTLLCADVEVQRASILLYYYIIIVDLDLMSYLTH